MHWTRPLLGPWGLLPLGALWSFVLARSLGKWLFAGLGRTGRELGGAIAALVVISAGTRIVAACSLARTSVLFVALTLVSLASAIVSARNPAPGVKDRPVGSLLDALSAPWLLLLAIELVLVGVAVFWLPVWQFDALGYHLPFVDFVLQSGSSAGVPSDLRYVGTYPHAVEWMMVGLRSLLPDDRLVDCVQIPLGLVGAGAVAAIARTVGARPRFALVAGVAWLTLPVVFLQLPTDYVDVAAAAFFLSAAFFVLQPVGSASLLGFGLSLGLFLGSKPQAPLGALLLGGVALVRAGKAKRGPTVALSLAAAVLIGGESYLSDWIRFGNPVWPVDLRLGPIHFPGPESMDKVLGSGAGSDHPLGNLPDRLIQSWCSIDTPPAFDMRRGGLGLLGLLSLLVGSVAAVRSRRWELGGLALAALASPDPAVVRYVLAFPGLGLALSAGRASEVAERGRARLIFISASWLLAGLAGWTVWRASSGLSGEGPPLARYARLDWWERELAVGASGRPDDFVQMRDSLLPGEAIAFDDGLDLPYQIWKPDLSTRGVYVPRERWASLDDAFVERERLRYVVRFDDVPVSPIGSHPLELAFHCKSSPCAAYRVQR